MKIRTENPRTVGELQKIYWMHNRNIKEEEREERRKTWNLDWEFSQIIRHQDIHVGGSETSGRLNAK